MLRTGCILHPGLGFRVSVMSRHTLSDGVTPDPRLDYHVHWKRLAPDGRLVGAYYRGEVLWEDFEASYLEKLKRVQSDLEALATLSRVAEVVILCVESEPSRCHRRILAEEVQRRYPGVLLDVR